MTRQLIVCCDGTNNNLTGRRNDTNVTQLCELLDPQNQNQVLYYDPGVGNPGELPGATWTDTISRFAERLYGLAFGKGIYENIQQAYSFIIRNWKPGDQIFLFGFSRGAFTARSVAGLVTQFGILQPEMDGLIPTLLHVYFSDRNEDNTKIQTEYKLIRKQIRDLYSNDRDRQAPLWFVGVWDTVASVGAPFLSQQITATPTIVDKKFTHVRHAMALDEYRKSFLPRPYVIEKGHDYAHFNQSIKQEWFTGAHCDIGGGYDNEQAGLSRQALLWMVMEAADCELRLTSSVLDSENKPVTGLIKEHLSARSARKGERRKIVHSETYDVPLWCLTGQVVRTPEDTLGFTKPALPPVQSPSVEANDLVFPGNTVWRQSRLSKPLHRRSRRQDEAGGMDFLQHPFSILVVATLIGVFFFAVSGALLLGPNVITGSNVWRQALSIAASRHEILQANLDFAWWQLNWSTRCNIPTDCLPQSVYAVRAMLVDFGFIAAYGYLLAFGVSWAFARIAGLRRIGMTPPHLLNGLGMAAPVALLSDIAENIITMMLLHIYPNGYFPGVEGLLGLCMTFASIAKWIGLSGCAILIVWGCMPKRKRAPVAREKL